MMSCDPNVVQGCKAVMAWPGSWHSSGCPSHNSHLRHMISVRKMATVLSLCPRTAHCEHLPRTAVTLSQ